MYGWPKWQPRLQRLQGVVDGVVGTAEAEAEAEPLSVALTLGMNKMEALFDNHKYTNCFGLKTGTSERDCVSPIREILSTVIAEPVIEHLDLSHIN